ncbi:MAG: helix-turn-helix transcriptional regulator [Clostridia bacterium]|nr:helix-turn-helix transcriptional regulator [Clostridia bacterium]
MLNQNTKRLLCSKILAAGYTQRSLADKVGMSKNALNAKINGKSEFNLGEINRICNALNICNPIEKAEIFLQ